MQWVHDDGGRADAGYKGTTGDCVVRSIAIAAGIPYQEVYDAINVMAKEQRVTKRRRKSSARNGVGRSIYDPYLKAQGFVWVPTMFFGSGCTTHLDAGELPKGRLLVRVSKHITAVIDGVIHDTYDPSREGTRCVYGYYCLPQGA